MITPTMVLAFMMFMMFSFQFLPVFIHFLFYYLFLEVGEQRKLKVVGTAGNESLLIIYRWSWLHR